MIVINKAGCVENTNDFSCVLENTYLRNIETIKINSICLSNSKIFSYSLKEGNTKPTFSEDSSKLFFSSDCIKIFY